MISYFVGLVCHYSSVQLHRIPQHCSPPITLLNTWTCRLAFGQMEIGTKIYTCHQTKLLCIGLVCMNITFLVDFTQYYMSINEISNKLKNK